MHKIDLMGKKYGSWTIVGNIPREKGKKGKIQWILRCKCGTEIHRDSNYIRKHWNPTDCGCSRSIVGKKYGTLTIIERLGKDAKHQANYVCKCDCGKEKIYRGNYLLSGIIKSCGCKRRNNTSENGQTVAWFAYRKNAKKRNLAFDLTKERFIKLIEQSCFYCGKKNTNKTYAYKRSNENEIFYHNGIDRYDNDRGYTFENSVTCCKLCNHMKWDLSYNDWQEHMRAILGFKPAGAG